MTVTAPGRIDMDLVTQACLLLISIMSYSALESGASVRFWFRRCRT